MFKQVAVSYNAQQEVESLEMWPLSLAELGRFVLPGFDVPEVYCAVAHSAWQDCEDNVLYPPPASEIIGRRLNKNHVIRVARRLLLSYLNLGASSNPPSDFLLFCPARSTASLAERKGIVRSFLNIAERDIVLKRLGGFWLYVHDGDMVSFRAARRDLAARFFRSCVAELVYHAEPCRLKRLWQMLRTDCQDCCLVIAGYEPTFFARKARRETVECAGFWEFWQSGSPVYRIGPYGGAIRKMVAEPEAVEFGAVDIDWLGP